MGNSESSYGSFSNKGEDYVTAIIEDHEYLKNGEFLKDENGEKIPSGHKFYLTSICYYYKHIGSHRVIQLGLDCNKCKGGWWIYMDKTSNKSKNINISKKDFFDFTTSKGYWTYWNRNIEKNKNFCYKDCLDLYHKAPDGYHLLKNNCADFARYIWENAPC